MLKPYICLLSIRLGLGPLSIFTIACVRACVCQNDDECGLRKRFSLNRRIKIFLLASTYHHNNANIPRVSIGVHMGIFTGKNN